MLGTLVGVLPGIGPALTIALLLPITFNFDDPVGAFILFAGIYAGGMYGGSTTSILLNTPGESASVATAIEGFEMAKRGRGRAGAGDGRDRLLRGRHDRHPAADGARRAGRRLAVKFRAEDYFALTLLAFASVTALTSSSLIRGFVSLFVGLLIGFVGIDQLTGQSRLTFGVDQLGNGVDIVIVAVGLFAVGEALHMASKLRSRRRGGGPPSRGRQGAGSRARTASARGSRGCAARASASRSARCPPAAPRCRRSSPTRPSEAQPRRGSGARARSRASPGPRRPTTRPSSGTLVPLLTLGIPTSATAAIMLAAFQIFDLQPGPELFEKNASSCGR